VGAIAIDPALIYGTRNSMIPQLISDSEERIAEQDGVSCKTILLVEDEPYVRDIAREVLEMCGYLVLSAKDAAEGIAIFEQHRGNIHLLVTDVVMPGMNGRELAERLIGRCPGLRTIFISGYADNSVVRSGQDSKTVYLQKPFTLEALTRKVREVIDAHPQSLARSVQ